MFESRLPGHNGGFFLELNGRLKQIADLVPHCRTLADVGTDHGYIPIYCASHGICDSALAMDINPMPLRSAQNNIIKYCLQDKIGVRLSDGLQALSADEADVIVIAGMGGLLMRDILSQGDAVIGNDTLLILQPMLAVRELREYLYSNGFDICDEYVCREQDKFYNIITARRGEGAHDDCDIIVGRNLRQNSPDTFAAYVDYRLRVLGKIANGMKKSAQSSAHEIDAVENELKIFEKARDMQ